MENRWDTDRGLYLHRYHCAVLKLLSGLYYKQNVFFQFPMGSGPEGVPTSIPMSVPGPNLPVMNGLNGSGPDPNLDGLPKACRLEIKC